MPALFEAFPKTQRFTQDLTVVVTEKIDGSNGQIYIADNCEPITLSSGETVPFLCGSRTRWVWPSKQQDNMGFASWAYANADELLKLGPGRHYGEWYGAKIQRGYGLDHKRFALFNSLRWGQHGQCDPPACCDVVPVIYHGPFKGYDHMLDLWQGLVDGGSLMVDGYMNPEGLWLYFPEMRHSMKMPFTK